MICSKQTHHRGVLDPGVQEQTLFPGQYFLLGHNTPPESNPLLSQVLNKYDPSGLKNIVSLSRKYDLSEVLQQKTCDFPHLLALFIKVYKFQFFSTKYVTCLITLEFLYTYTIFFTITKQMSNFFLKMLGKILFDHTAKEMLVINLQY